MKKAFLIPIILVLIALLLPSCTAAISPEEYAKVSTDLALAMEQNSILQKALSAREDELQRVQSQLVIATDNAKAKEDELQRVQSQLVTATDKLDKAKAKMQVINALFLAVFKGEKPSTAYFLEWATQIKAIADPILTDKFNRMVEEATKAHFEEFFAYLFESTAKGMD